MARSEWKLWNDDFKDLDHVLADNYAATVSILSLHHPFDIFSAGIIKAESIYVTVMSWQEHIVADQRFWPENLLSKAPA